jgi:hypothetical protein
LVAHLHQLIGDLQNVIIQPPAYPAAVEERDGSWIATDHGDYPAKEGVVAGIVSGLTAMTKVEPKTDNPDWYRYIQVADPAATPAGGTATAESTQPPASAGTRVTSLAANGDVLADTIVGSVSTTISAAHGRGGTFVRNAGDPQSWLVEGTVGIPMDLGEWFNPVMNVPSTSVTAIEVLIGDKTVFDARKPDPKAGHYEIVHLDESVGASGSVANDTIIHNLSAGIVNVSVRDARARDSVTPGPTARTDRFTLSDGMQVEVTLVDADGSTWAMIDASAPEGSDAAKTAASINALTDHWALKLGAVQTANLTVDLKRLVQAPGGNADQGAASQGGASLVPGGPGTLLPPSSGGTVLPNF